MGGAYLALARRQARLAQRALERNATGAADLFLRNGETFLEMVRPEQ